MLAFTFLFAGLLAMSVSAQDVDKLKYPKLHELAIPQVEKITLDNGIRLYLLPDRSLPVFNASVRINCGSFLEPADKVGLADICGTVMRSGGTKKWTGDEIDEQLEAVGGSVETNIGLESASARVDILSDYTDLGLDVLSQVLRYPVFDQDKIDLAKVRERTSISRRNDDPQQIAVREFKKVIYGPESVYARIPEYATISAINRDDLVKFHDAYFHPQNVQMAFWGDFDRDSLLAEINKYFGDWAKEGDPVPALPKIDYQFASNKVYYINKSDVNQTNILLGHIGGLMTDQDYPDRIVMNNIFGGGFGSRLFNSVRSKEGLAYSAFGVYTANIKYPGIFYGFASTKSETTVKAVKGIISEIKRMQVDAPTPDEMRMGKDGYLNSFVFNFDSKAEIVNRMMNYDFNGLPQDFLTKTRDAVEKVTSADVLAAAQKNLRPDDLNIVVVGKGDDFDMPLDQAGLGPVTTVDITIPAAEQKTEVTVTPESLKKGQALLDKAVQANGGLANFKKVTSVAYKGVITIVAQGREFPLNFESKTVYPDKSAQVMTMMGQKMYSIRNGNSGWKTGQGGVVAMTEDDISQSDDDMARNTIRIFSSADKPAYQPVYDGSGTLNDVTVDYLAIMNKDGDQICRFAFDTNGKLVGKSYWGDSPQGQGTIQEVYSDFQDIKGIKVPMTTTRMLEGKTSAKISISEYNVNPPISDDAFAKPE